MKKDDLAFGLDGWERLEMDADSALERIMEEYCATIGEDFDAVADRITWPIHIQVFKRQDVGGEGCAQTLARRAIEGALENLDEEHGDYDGDPSDPTEGMKAAALAFGRAVVDDYVPWIMKSNGDVVVYTREQVQALEEPAHDPPS